MELCYYTSESKFKRNIRDNSRKLNHLHFQNDLIHKSPHAASIIETLLLDFCEVNICGYNVDNKYYWGKKMENQICTLMFTLSIDANNITIIPLIGSDSCIKELYLNMLEGLEIYKNSRFLFE